MGSLICVVLFSKYHFLLFFPLTAGSLMTTKHSQPQSTFAKSLTSTSTNAPYFRAAGAVSCPSLWFSPVGLPSPALGLPVKFFSSIGETSVFFQGDKEIVE